MNAKYFVFFIFLCFLTCTARQNVFAGQPDSRRWEQAIREFEAADKSNPPDEGGILFTGSSTIRLWNTLAQDFPEHKVINRGFGGCYIEDCTFYADRIVIPYKPRLIVLRAGCNDINGGKTPEEVRDDFKAFVEKVREKLPQTRIAYMTINATPSRWANVEREKKANRLIQDYVSQGENLDFIDPCDATLDAAGKPREDLFVEDRLHFNAAGYKILADAVRPHLKLPAKTSKELIAYVGTFSSPLRDVLRTQVDLPPGNGRGIHIFQVNRETGEMKPASIYEMGTSPNCLVLNDCGTRLYSTNETDRLGEKKEGTLSAFSVDQSDGNLTLLNTVGSGGSGPTYLSIHPSGRFMLVANYFSGSIAVLPILPDGRLGKAADIQQVAGNIGPARAANAPPGSFAFSGHDGTHSHMIQSDPSGRFVLHVDLGLDKIFIWKFDEQKGVLTPNKPPAISLPAGDGPRHFHFHPKGNWLYSIQEEGSTVVLFDYDDRTGRLAARQTVSTLPPGFAGSNFCSEILVSHDGKFVYAGNRLHDSIGIFSVGANGDLTYVGEEWTRGDYPRSFNFDPAGKFLYCCNQRGDNVTVFAVDCKTGGLNFTGRYVPVGNPSSIVFLDLAREK